MRDESFAASLGQLLAELERLRVSAHRLLMESSVPDPFEPSVDLSDAAKQLGEVLAAARGALLQDPVGAGAIVRFLSDQGREYAGTPEGRTYQEALMASPAMAQLRLLWDASTFGVFDEESDTSEVPNAWIDLLSDVISSQTEIESLLAALNPGRRS